MNSLSGSNLADFIDVFDGLELLMKAATVTFEGEEDIAKVAFTVMQQIAEQRMHHLCTILHVLFSF